MAFSQQQLHKQRIVMVVIALHDTAGAGAGRRRPKCSLHAAAPPRRCRHSVRVVRGQRPQKPRSWSFRGSIAATTRLPITLIAPRVFDACSQRRQAVDRAEQHLCGSHTAPAAHHRAALRAAAAPPCSGLRRSPCRATRLTVAQQLAQAPGCQRCGAWRRPAAAAVQQRPNPPIVLLQQTSSRHSSSSSGVSISISASTSVLCSSYTGEAAVGG